MDPHVGAAAVDAGGDAHVGAAAAVGAGGDAHVGTATTSVGGNAPAAAALCANCGTQISDLYCSHCGQKVASPVHSVSHFAADVTEDLTHADSRLWSTLLALIFQPGLLTREFLDGRRVRYLPPLRLYLVLSLVFFLVVLAAPIHVRIMTQGDKTAKQDCHLDYQGPFAPKVNQVLEKACREQGSGRDDALGELVVHSLSRAMFVFLPVLALVMVPLYRRPRRFYVEHLLLFIHNHAFVFLFGILGLLVGRIVPEGLPSILLALAWIGYVPWYVYRSMRRVYGQGRWLTIAKLAVIGVAYVICAEIMVLATALYSVVAV